MGQVNILLYYGGPWDEGKEEGGMDTKVATGQGTVRGKNSSRSGKSQRISLRVRDNSNL